MNRKRLPWLVAATALTVAVAGVLLVVDRPAQPSRAAADEPLFASLAADLDEVDAAMIETPRYRLELRKSGGDWVAANLGSYPVRQVTADRLVSSLALARAYEAKTDDPALHAAIGVEFPDGDGIGSTLVSVENAGGDILASAVVGLRSSSIGFSPLGGTFIRRPDEERAWLVQGTIEIPPEQDAWFDPIVHVPGTEVRRVSIFAGRERLFEATKGQDASSTYALTYVSDRLSRPGVTADDSAVKQIGLGIVSTRFTEVRPASDMQLPADARRIRFETGSGMVLDVTLADADAGTWLLYEASAPEGSAGAAQAAEITERTAGWAFRVPDYRLAPLQVEVADLLTEAEPPSAGPPSLSAPVGPGATEGPANPSAQEPAVRP